MTKISLLAALICLASLFLPSQGQALMLGQEVTVAAVWNSNPITILDQSDAPVVVGDGVEFNGSGTFVFGQDWHFEVNISDTSFSLNITETTNPNNLGGILFSYSETGEPAPGFYLAIAGLDFSVQQVTLESYTNSFLEDLNASLTYPESEFPYDVSSQFCDLILEDAALGINLAVGLSGLRSGDSYVFNVSDIPLSSSEPIPTPEPSTMLLLGSGLAGLGWYNRKQKKS